MKFAIAATLAVTSYAAELLVSDDDKYKHQLTYWVGDNTLYLEPDLLKKDGQWEDMEKAKVGQGWAIMPAGTVADLAGGAQNLTLDWFEFIIPVYFPGKTGDSSVSFICRKDGGPMELMDKCPWSAGDWEATPSYSSLKISLSRKLDAYKALKVGEAVTAYGSFEVDPDESVQDPAAITKSEPKALELILVEGSTAATLAIGTSLLTALITMQAF